MRTSEQEISFLGFARSENLCFHLDRCDINIDDILVY